MQARHIKIGHARLSAVIVVIWKVSFFCASKFERDAKG